MQITGSYSNYLAVTNLLSPVGVRGSGDLVMQVFASAVKNLQHKIDQQIFSKESDAALKQLYNEVSDLASQAEKLTLTDFNSVFFDRTSTSSDPNVLTATAVDAFSVDSGAAEATYNISVSQLSISQENTGADAVSTAAQDAAYTVDGTEYTSETNTIYLDGGLVAVNLKGVGESILTVSPNHKEVENAITAFVSEVNSFIDFLEANSDYIKDEVLSSMNSFITDHKMELESLGITPDEDGTLVIDTDKLATAVSDNLSGIKKTFGGLDGLAVQTENHAARIATDSPLNYAKEAEGMSMDFVDYLYGTSATMLKGIIQGMLLNTFG